jgi:hypothetical protein
MLRIKEEISIAPKEMSFLKSLHPTKNTTGPAAGVLTCENKPSRPKGEEGGGSSRHGAPTVVVDGCEFTWQEFGEFLSSFTGFNFRLECFDACDDPETTPDPERPEHVWWLSNEADEPSLSPEPPPH